MRVLFLHPAGAFGGASKSLVELYTAAKELGSIESTILTPRGTASKAFEMAGMKVEETIGLSQFDHTRYGFYRKLRWIILLREFFFLPFTFFSLLKIRRSQNAFDLIHVNEITLLPTALMAKWLFKLPIVMHIRSVQHSNHSSIRSQILFKLVSRYIKSVICIDETVRASLPAQVRTNVIHNSININTTSKRTIDGRSTVNVGMAGVLLRAKGIYEFLEAARILIIEKKRDVRFIIAGENPRDAVGIKNWTLRKIGFSEDVLSNAEKFVQQNALQQQVIFKGFVADIQDFYPEIDIMCFPSYLNACGRPVFEAAFFGIPSIVAIQNPFEDALIDGVTGLAIKTPDPILLADAIDKLLVETNLRTQLGQQAMAWAKQYYGIEKNASLLSLTYKELLQQAK